MSHPGLKQQYEEHTAHPPRLVTDRGYFLVEAYSPVTHGYILMAEWMTKELAELDLKSWQESWTQEQASFQTALGVTA